MTERYQRKCQTKQSVPITTSNNSDFTVGLASGSLKAEAKECLTGKGQVLSKGLRAQRIRRWLMSILLLIKIVYRVQSSMLGLYSKVSM